MSVPTSDDLFKTRTVPGSTRDPDNGPTANTGDGSHVRSCHTQESVWETTRSPLLGTGKVQWSCIRREPFAGLKTLLPSFT